MDLRSFVLLLLVPPLAAPLIPEDIMVGVLAIILISFSAVKRKDIRLKVSSVNEETSIFNTLLLSLLLYLSVFMGIPAYIVMASMFIVAAYTIKGGSLQNIVVFTVSGFLYFFYYFFLSSFDLNYNMLFFLSLIGGLTAALVESIDVNSDKKVTILLAVSTVYLIFDIYSFNAPMNDLAIAFIVAFLLSMSAMKSGIADESGLMSATLVGTLVIVFTDLRYFIILVSFYMLGSVSTKYKYKLKRDRGVAEPAGGARGYSNVFGNSLSPMFFAISYGVYGYDLFLISFVASVATALGDTMASEIGKTSQKVYLITNLKKVTPGVSGGISVIGELAAFAGATIVASLSVAMQVLNIQGATVALIAGFLAIHVDSLLGATLEEGGYLTNSGVNFLATLSAGGFCYIALI